MTIRFLCPNGHGLSSTATQAGSYGKCPTCEAMFQVPFTEGSGGELRKAEAVIGFTCPAGHAIRVPARMAGQLGKCPACEKTVRVPGAAQTETATSTGTSNSVSSKGASESSNGDSATSESKDALENASLESAIADGIMLDPDANDETADSSPGDSAASGSVGHYPHAPSSLEAGDSPFGSHVPGAVFPSIANPADSPHAMTALFEALWDGTQRDAIVDVYFGDNERISPQHYAHELSHGQHAVFAVLEQNDTHTLYLIPWAKIHRVAVREITELPPGMFD